MSLDMPARKKVRWVEEPSSSDHIEIDLRRELEETKKELAKSIEKYDNLVGDLKDAVECRVCYSIPRRPPVLCCRNGHPLCQRCRSKCETTACPTCRTPKTDCVSQTAAIIIQKIEHFCEFRDEGCTVRAYLNEIAKHEERCPFRLVRCPHWACDEQITARNLTHHVIAAECGDSYRDKPLPYKEEMVYTQALDDEEGNGFWKPSLLQFDGYTFYLQVEKCGKNKNWYFYIQMEASSYECKKYGTTIRVTKHLGSDRNSVLYNGAVCSIDVKGAVEVDACGAGLNIRDSAMEKIFDVNVEKDDESIDDGDQEEEKPREFKFWVDVDIYKISD